MDYYTLLKFAHIVGFILLGGGLLAVFASEFQAYRTTDMKVFAEASRYRGLLRQFRHFGRPAGWNFRLLSHS